jgi:hypothetical protein
MDRKNINDGFKKLNVWQDAVSLFVLACKILGKKTQCVMAISNKLFCPECKLADFVKI